MKVQLERKVKSCSDRLPCAVCGQTFNSPNIRALLYTNAGLLQGDVCPHCLTLNPEELKHTMRERAYRLMQLSESDGKRFPSVEQLAIELFRTADEDVQKPAFYHWWLKRLEILSEETQELEAARLGTGQCACGKRSPLRIRFEEEC